MRVLLAPGQMRPEPAGVPLSVPDRGLAAPQVAGALARGWLAARPGDDVVELPMADGSPGSAQCLPPRRIRGREALQGRGPTGQIREVDLVQLDPAPAAGQGGLGRTWFLDAARLLALPADAARAAQEAREGTTRGLGEVMAQALGRTSPGDTLIVGLSRSAVNDGGAGLIEALGHAAGGAKAGAAESAGLAGPAGPAPSGAGLAAARALLAGRSVGLALADGLSLGGVSGAGAALGRLAGISAQEAQDLDRAACARGARLLSQARGLDAAESGSQTTLGASGALGRPGPRLLPVVGGSQDRLSVTSWGTGAGGGAALALRALGAWAGPGARVMAGLLGLQEAMEDRDMAVVACGEAFDVLADSVVAVVGLSAGALALPAVLVAGRCVVPRSELAAAGISASYAVETLLAQGVEWDAGGPQQIEARLEAMGARLARTWSR